MNLLGILNVTQFLIDPVFWKKSSNKLIITEVSDLKEQFLGPYSGLGTRSYLPTYLPLPLASTLSQRDS